MSDPNYPFFIRSKDNPDLALIVPDPTAAGVVFGEVEANDWSNPNNMWVVRQLASSGVSMISLYSSNNSRFLAGSAATVDSPIQLAAADPTSDLNLWQLKGNISNSEPLWLTFGGAAGLEAGFPGDVPVPGRGLTLVAAHDSHDSGDMFIFDPLHIGPPAASTKKGSK